MRPVFVGGLHRSGTSLLARCLVAHPQIGGFGQTGVWEDEGQHVQDALLPARLLGGPGRFAHHPAAHLGPVTPAEAERLRARLLACWRPLWPTGQRWVVSKSPPDLLRGRLLAQLFPGSPLFVMRRHPIAVALATRAMSRKLARLPIPALVEHWIAAHDLLARDLPSLDRPVVLDLPLLVEDPRRELGRVFARLELDPVGPPEALLDRDAPYREQWARLGRGLRGADLIDALRPLAPGVARHGYDLLGFEQRGSPVLSGFSPH